MKYNTQIFIEKSKEIHNSPYYDYSKVNYINYKSKCEMYCSKLDKNNIEHGTFFQSFGKHIFCKQGCPKCGREKMEDGRRYSQQQFIDIVTKVHKGYYDYSKSIYTGRKYNVIITCPEHGDFNQQAGHHMKGGICPKHAAIICSKANPPLTTEIFIERSIKFHGKAFDYSLSKYINSHIKVKIKCNKCNNIFEQLPFSHMAGNGCNICRSSKGELKIRKYLTEKNIQFKQEHKFIDCISKNKGLSRFDFYLPEYNLCIEYDGDQHIDGKYVWSSRNADDILDDIHERDLIKNDYCTNKGIKLLRIYLWDYDNIEKLIDDALKGIIKIEQPKILKCGRKVSIEEFKQIASKKHNNFYNYNKTTFNSVFDKATITCPEHGDFIQMPMNHMKGHECHKCATIKVSNKNRMTKEEFVERAIKVHGNKYDYSKSDYIGYSKKLSIHCSRFDKKGIEHGNFIQRPCSHLDNQGCPKCGKESWMKTQSLQRRSTKEEFVNKANKVHNNYYDYSKSIYINGKTKLEIICPEHGSFWQIPNNHKSGCGCPKRHTNILTT
jgi:hypothetical protein